ncbi:KICSTOR complex protein kaptin [Caerostris extrusa]|uniref:KICSTOR complex protein kaptin n=1 Tax=Caerostris extrusa TaxID=172846 RepID=A0AAV4YB22_CAEEX|nr:KICSTOR complex protein kaptin [Caerostris extrusa]
MCQTLFKNMNTIEAHFYGIPFQSSIYGLTSLLFSGESSHKILVASSKRKVYCIEYSKNQQSVNFSTREVQFTYIPGGAEIISIDAFNQAYHEHDYVVGITFTKCDTSGAMSQYLNIYSKWEPMIECDLDNIAQGCLSICLDFVPFHLTHTELFINGKKEVVWLLSGNDIKVHLYREDKIEQAYCEEPSTTCFPEFSMLDSLVMWMDFLSSPESRIAAFGCKDGHVIVTSVKLPETCVQASWKIQHDAPICTVRLFQDSNILNKPLMGNMIEMSVVYRDILKNGLELTSQEVLMGSNKSDCVTCGLVADIDMDGNNEILLGTYGQQLMVFKWNVEGSESYTSYDEQMFSYPLLQLSYVDVTGDGVKELLVLTTNGLHILQHDLTKVSTLCLSRMEWIIKNVPAEKLEEYLKIE